MNKRAMIVTMAALLGASLFLARSAVAAEKIDFEPVVGFPNVPDGIELGQCSGVAVDRKGQIYLFHRNDPPVICFDADGNFVRSWGDGMFSNAHGLRIDREGNLWVTDTGHHVVMKFSPTGKLLLTLGKAGNPGLGTDQFDKPTDIAFGAKGEIYISDGYGNSRVMKFTAEGKFLTTWGKPGDGPGQFNLPHTIVVDAKGQVIVGDRENDRLQIFDGDGKLLKIQSGFAPFGLVLDKDGVLFVADGRANKVLMLNEQYEVERSWGQTGHQPGQFDIAHMLSADRHGNLYVVDIQGKRLQKLARKR